MLYQLLPLLHPLLSYCLQTLVDGDVRDADSEVEPSLADARTGAARALADYVTGQYNTDSVTSAVYAPVGSQAVHLVIYGEKLNLRNYWSVSWLSVWKVDVEGGEPVISGTIKVGY